MTQSSFTRLLVRVQIGSLVVFLLAAAVAVIVMLPYFADGAVKFERYSVREGIARYAGVCGLASAAASMLAGFGLRSR
jgi:hypothetical protein